MPSTKSMLLRVVLLLEIILLVTAHGERRKFCGIQLTETLQFYCRNRYASPQTTFNEKRSGDNQDYAYLSDEPLSDNSPFSYQSMPFLANFDSAAALRPRERRDYYYFSQQRGIADECCINACTVEQLKKYCQ